MTQETKEMLAILVALAPWLAFLIAVVGCAVYSWFFGEREPAASGERARRLHHGHY